jgi:hypothetical protein
VNVIELRNVEVVYTGRAKPSLVVDDFHVERVGQCRSRYMSC